MRNASPILLPVALLSALALVGCTQPTGSSSTTSTTATTTTVPTLANLTGTWVESYSSPTAIMSLSGSTPATEVTTDTMTIAADGSYVSIESYVSTPSGSSTPDSTYTAGSKGIISISSSGMTMTKTYDAVSSLTPFTASTATWTPVVPNTSDTQPNAFIYGGKLYRYAAVAQGSVSGIVGTWEMASSGNDGTTTNYYKEDLTFSATGSLTDAAYQSTTSTFPASPSSTQTATYAVQNGILTETFTSPSASTSTIAYKIIGNYLVFGNATSSDANAYVKQ